MKNFIFLMSTLLVFVISNHVYCNKTTEEEKLFKIKGKIDSTNIEKFVFKYYRCEKDSLVIDTIPVINGTFKIEGLISPRCMAYLYINDKEVRFYMDPEEMQLFFKKDSLEKFVLIGSKTQEDKEKMDTLTKHLEDSLSIINKQIYSELNERNRDFLNNQKDSIENLLENFRIDFISSYPSSHYSLDLFFYLLLNKNQNGDTLMNLFDRLSNDVKMSCSGKQMYDYILQRKKSSITNASNLEALDKEGTLIKMSDFEGKYILIDFWASWCTPCIKGFHHLKELYAKYKDKGLVVISISIDREEDEQKWLNSIEKHNIGEWIHILSDKNKGEKNICNLYENVPGTGIPYYILINKSGEVIKQWRGFSDEIAKEQEEIFKNFFEK